MCLQDPCRKSLLAFLNLNLTISFQRVRGDRPPPSVFQTELLFVSRAAGQALPDPSGRWPGTPSASERRCTAACLRAPSAARLRKAAAFCLGQKGRKRTLILPFTAVGHMSRVAHLRPFRHRRREELCHSQRGVRLGVPLSGGHLSSREAVAWQAAAKLLHIWCLTTDLPAYGVSRRFVRIVEPEILRPIYLFHYRLHCASVIPLELM